VRTNDEAGGYTYTVIQSVWALNGVSFADFQ